MPDSDNTPADNGKSDGTAAGRAGHTPGPWSVHPAIAQVDSSFIGSDGRPLPICQLLWPTEERTKERTFANARLIAAAPELLEALADLMENPAYQTAIGGNPIAVEALVQRATRALAKARGEA